jgi:hypothetical protein
VQEVEGDQKRKVEEKPKTFCVAFPCCSQERVGPFLVSEKSRGRGGRRRRIGDRRGQERGRRKKHTWSYPRTKNGFSLLPHHPQQGQRT